MPETCFRTVWKLISANVRDEAGTTLFRAVLVFRCEWPG